MTGQRPQRQLVKQLRFFWMNQITPVLVGPPTDPRLNPFLQRMRKGERTRIVAFGSSNTDARNRCQFNWVDWFDTGLKMTFGRVHHTINTGIGGDTTRGLLRRFDTDLAFYEPHLALLTIGGNDSSPNQEMDEDEFRKNLADVSRKILAGGRDPGASRRACRCRGTCA